MKKDLLEFIMIIIIYFIVIFGAFAILIYNILSKIFILFF